MSGLLARLDDMKARNADLEKTVRDKEEHIEELQARLDALNNDKNEINDKVSNLLSAIEEWEKAGGEEKAQDSPSESGEVAGADSATATTDDDNAPGNNGNLFSMGG